ncbi:MAG: FAD-dependent oxidoreductase [bacterium]|nr:FAD-dependent oxidoreductase [candidate division KSB1 bacterium]MDH7559292.1 FAD-dependent oxidoreductase [bacterium]
MDVLVVGASTGGVCAAIQAARLGVKVALVEETPWLGGMLTAAGVSAVDGNHLLPSGLWGEFRQHLYDHYGGPQEVATGWVSNTLFEPHVGEAIFRRMVAAEPSINVTHGYWPVRVLTRRGRVQGVQFANRRGELLTIRATATIDATEYGDVLAGAGCAYDLGRDARSQTGEPGAPEAPDPFIQDLTYVAILKDYGQGHDRTVGKPRGYDEQLYTGTCRELGGQGTDAPDCGRMLSYGRLPGRKFMVNWPVHGNDCYLNVVELPRPMRRVLLQQAKRTTLGWICFVQKHLGWRHLGLADDEFPTRDRLPLIPYNREARRVRGVVCLTTLDLVNPYNQGRRPLYKTGIAVGDYPLDHHHARCPVRVEETFPEIPAFTVPYGCLVPEEIDGLLVAEKTISVTHLVNGCTRLQPVVMLVGQAAGAAAALCVLRQCQPRQLAVRALQETLLRHGCYLMPFTDCPRENPFFDAVQRVGVCGLMRAMPKPSGWANQMLFLPEAPVELPDAHLALLNARLHDDLGSLLAPLSTHRVLTRAQVLGLICRALGHPIPLSGDAAEGPEGLSEEVSRGLALAGERGWLRGALAASGQRLSEPMPRAEFAYLLDKALDPFAANPVSLLPEPSS